MAFAPIRKQGKLPGAVLQSAYSKEYGSVRLAAHQRGARRRRLMRWEPRSARRALLAQDTFEIQQAAIAAGQRVLVVDDLLATGGTAASAIDLVQRLGGAPTGFCCVVELPALNGRGRLPAGLPVFSLVQRDG